MRPRTALAFICMAAALSACRPSRGDRLDVGAMLRATSQSVHLAASGGSSADDTDGGAAPGAAADADDPGSASMPSRRDGAVATGAATATTTPASRVTPGGPTTGRGFDEAKIVIGVELVAD